MKFLERMEELAESPKITCDHLLPGLVIILRENALKWYKANREGNKTGEAFRLEIGKFFHPTRHIPNLKQTFFIRRGNNRERAKDYMLIMLTLTRKNPHFRKHNYLDRIYDGPRTEYRHYIRRTVFACLNELVSLADDYVALRRE